MTDNIKPPIPEVSVAPIQLQRGEAPDKLNFMVGLIALSTALNLVIFDPAFVNPVTSTGGSAESILGQRIVEWFVTLLWLACLHHLWRGKQWARVVTMLLCPLSVLTLFSLSTYPYALQRAFAVLDAIFYLYLFFWLARPEVARYFKPQREYD
jgi:hypothetical protein